MTRAAASPVPPGPVVFWPFPTHPHVGPTLGVAQELVRRGRRVVHVAPEPFRAAVTGAGSELLPYPVEPRPLVPGSTDPVDHAFGHYLAVLSAASWLEEQLRGCRPAALVYDTHLWGTAAGLAQRLGARGVQAFPTFATGAGFSLRRAEAAASGDGGPEHPSVALFWRRVAEVADAGGYGGYDRAAFLAVESGVNVVFLPREFQIAGEGFDDRFAFVGPCPGTGPLAGAWSPPAGARRVALVSLGTSPFGRDAGFFRGCVDALAAAGHHLVLTAGDAADDVGPVPGSVEVHRWLPHPAVLRHADVFVTQGGIGSMMEALAEGVPLVLSPRNGEQRVNAARAVELGLGALLPDEPDPAALRDAVAAATTDVGVRERVAAMRGAIARAGGARAAADAITGG